MDFRLPYMRDSLLLGANLPVEEESKKSDQGSLTRFPNLLPLIVVHGKLLERGSDNSHFVYTLTNFKKYILLRLFL